MLQKKELFNFAKKVRESYVETPYGQCYPASKHLKKRLISETEAEKDEVEIVEVYMGDFGTIRHYVVAFPAKYVSDSQTRGRLLIDITLDQYCDIFEAEGKVEFSLGKKEDIPEINIFESQMEAPYS